MSERQKSDCAFGRAVVYVFSFIMGFIVFLLLFCAGQADYSYKRIFLLENKALFCFGILLGTGLVLGRRRLGKFRDMLETHSSKAVFRLTVLLVPAQIYMCYNAYFYTEWDVAMIVRNTFNVVEGIPLADVSYFSCYPNNVLLLAIFSLVKKADLYFGILDVQEGIMGILCVQCILSGLTGYLLFKIIQNFAGYWSAWCGWLCYLVLIGTSGWLMIPYSDSMGLVFPTALLYLYLKTQNGRHAELKWFMTGLFSCLGYYLKPQILIVFIAAVAAELLMRKSKAVKKKFRRRGLPCALAGIAAASIVQSSLTADITSQLDKEKAFGMSHFVMMGLNMENNGAYLEEDVDFSKSFSTKAARTEANMEAAAQRLKEMGAGGLGIHLVRKLLTDYGDGTFAWRQEGRFFGHIYEQKNKLVSPMLRNVIWGSGAANALNETWKQGVWLCVAASSLGVIGCRKRADSALVLVLLALIGLTLFELLFEARARYLYIYVPFYIVTGVLGAGKIAAAAGSVAAKAELHLGEILQRLRSGK